MRILDKIISTLRGHENELFCKIREHLDLSISALQALMNPECELNSEQCVRKVSEYEKRGDEIAREIFELVSRGAVTMQVLNITELLTHALDDVLDEIHILSKELDRLRRHSRNTRLVSRIFQYIMTCGEKALQGLNNLKTMFSQILSEDIKSTKSTIGLIEKLEEEVDELKNSMLETIYSEASSLSIVEFYASISIVYMVDTILDKIKDVAELAFILMLSLS